MELKKENGNLIIILNLCNNVMVHLRAGGLYDDFG